MNKVKKIFGYGSLINKSSLKKTVPDVGNIVPVNLYDYMRLFELSSKWRKSENSGSVAVLNIRKKKGSVINGVCFDVSQEYYDALLEREGAYNMEKVMLESLDDDNKGEMIEASVFMTTPEKTQEFLYYDYYQMEYLKICLEGAKDFGEEFYEEFKKTTYIGNKCLKEMEEYLEKVLNMPYR